MTGILWLILSWLVTTWIYGQYQVDTGYIQEQIAIEWYFDRVESFDNLVYRRWRVLWQPFKWIKWWHLLNRTDCWWLMVWYMIHLWLLESRFRNNEGKRRTYDKGWLNSYRLYKLGKPKKESKRQYWDFVFMTFSWWVRHRAIYCWENKIYDIYKRTKARCRKMPKYETIKYSTNGLAEYLKDNGIMLNKTKDIIKEVRAINNKRHADYVNGLVYSIYNISSIYKTSL